MKLSHEHNAKLLHPGISLAQLDREHERFPPQPDSSFYQEQISSGAMVWEESNIAATRNNRSNMVRYVFDFATKPHIQAPSETFRNPVLTLGEEVPDSSEERRWSSSTVVSDNAPSISPKNELYQTGQSCVGTNIFRSLKLHDTSTVPPSQEKEADLAYADKYPGWPSGNEFAQLRLIRTPEIQDEEHGIEVLKCDENWVTVSEELQMLENVFMSQIPQTIRRPKEPRSSVIQKRNDSSLVEQRSNALGETILENNAKLPPKLRQSSTIHIGNYERVPCVPGIYCNGQLIESSSPTKKSGIQPSRFCHICLRRAERVALLGCSRLGRGCRKVICERCFTRFGWDWETAARSGSEWTCTHCRNVYVAAI